MSLDFIPDQSSKVIRSEVKKPEPPPVNTTPQKSNPPSLNTYIGNSDDEEEQAWLRSRGIKDPDESYFSGSARVFSDEVEEDDIEFDSATELLLEYRYVSWLLAKLVDGITEWGMENKGVPNHLYDHYIAAWDQVNGESEEYADDDMDPEEAAMLDHLNNIRR